jgi:Protein of unknown function DUF88.
MEDKRYAVLIDSDNISSKYITSILDEMTKYGVVTYKRIYGDWTTSQSTKWKKELMENSITPIQQFRNTVGKNATDSTLIIDAMAPPARPTSRNMKIPHATTPATTNSLSRWMT